MTMILSLPNFVYPFELEIDTKLPCSSSLHAKLKANNLFQLSTFHL